MQDIVNGNIFQRLKYAAIIQSVRWLYVVTSVWDLWPRIESKISYKCGSDSQPSQCQGTSRLPVTSSWLCGWCTQRLAGDINILENELPTNISYSDMDRQIHWPPDEALQERCNRPECVSKQKTAILNTSDKHTVTLQRCLKQTEPSYTNSRVFISICFFSFLFWHFKVP
jgi:hypothetical protein